MIVKYVNQPLGIGVGDGLQGARLADGAGVLLDVSFAHQPKLWIQAALAAASVASSLIGSAKSADAMRDAERRQRAQEAKEQAWYNRRYNEDYIDTAAGQNLIRRAKDYAKEQWKKAEGAQAVAGGTAAATQMAKDAGNKMVGDTIANVAAQDQARKAQVDNMHRQAEGQFAQMDMAREQQRAQNISNAASAASNALASIGSAVEQANTNTTSLQGGNNNGTEVVKSDGGNGATVQMNNMAGNTVHLKSNVGGISGDYDADKLRDLIGAAR